MCSLRSLKLINFFKFPFHLHFSPSEPAIKPSHPLFSPAPFTREIAPFLMSFVRFFLSKSCLFGWCCKVFLLGESTICFLYMCSSHLRLVSSDASKVLSLLVFYPPRLTFPLFLVKNRQYWQGKLLSLSLSFLVRLLNPWILIWILIFTFSRRPWAEQLWPPVWRFFWHFVSFLTVPTVFLFTRVEGNLGTQTYSIYLHNLSHFLPACRQERNTKDWPFLRVFD